MKWNLNINHVDSHAHLITFEVCTNKTSENLGWQFLIMCSWSGWAWLVCLIHNSFSHADKIFRSHCTWQESGYLQLTHLVNIQGIYVLSFIYCKLLCLFLATTCTRMVEKTVYICVATCILKVWVVDILSRSLVAILVLT